MEIRNFKEEDRSSVIFLWEDCGLTRPWNDANKDIDRKMEFQPDLFFVGEVNSKIIATAMAGYDGHRGSVFYFAIAPSLQGRGFGQKLMIHIEKELKKLGCPKLNIVVRTTNESVLRFYNSLSYKTDNVVSIGKRLILDE